MATLPDWCLSPGSRGERISPHTREFNPISGLYANPTTCVADEAVWIEPFSAPKFPDHQGKYREFLRFWPFSKHPSAERLFVYLINLGKFPTQRNKEFLQSNREFLFRIREFSGRIRENVRLLPNKPQCNDGYSQGSARNLKPQETAPAPPTSATPVGPELRESHRDAKVDRRLRRDRRELPIRHPLPGYK